MNLESATPRMEPHSPEFSGHSGSGSLKGIALPYRGGFIPAVCAVPGGDAMHQVQTPIVCS